MHIRALLELDARLSSDLHIAERPGPLRNAAAVLAHSGDSWFWGAALLLLWWAGASFWKQWSIVMLVSISVLAAVVMTLKFVIRRRRPEGRWGSIYRNSDPHSFPSGHAARAFLIAVLAAGLGPAWAAVALWLWAPLVSIARVAMGVHYFSDVVAGLIVGILSGLVALQLHGQLLALLTSLLGFALW
ncbi:MAG: phosphatase PAP2 family protein [Anaerolineales bacterium]